MFVFRNPCARAKLHQQKRALKLCSATLSAEEPVLEVVEFRSADWAEKYFSAQSARSSSRATLSLSYTKQFSSSIDLVAWPVQREGCRGEFQKKKKLNEAEEIASHNMGARNRYSSVNFLGGFIESIS